MDENVNETEATTPEQNLGQAAEATSPESLPAPEIKQPTPEEIELQRERSGIGRRMYAVERELKDKMTGIESTLNQIKSFIQTPGQPQADDDDPEQTKQKQLFNQWLSEEQLKVQKAQNKFMETLAQISLSPGNQDTEEEFNEIRKEIAENYHQDLSDKPEKDAEAIYYRVKYALEKRKTAAAISGKVSPLRGEKPKAPLGGSQANKMTSPKTNAVNLSQMSKRIVKDMGLSDEEISGMLSKPLPLGVRE